MIPVVTLGVYFTFIYDLFATVEFYYGATQYVMFASIIGAVLNVVLNALFIPRFGFIAAAYTTLVCYIVFMAMHYLFSKKVLRIQNIDGGVYNNRIVFLISFITLAVGLASMLTFNYLYVRFALIAAIIILCIIKRHAIKSLITAVRR